MSITVVHDYYFKPQGDVAAGKAAAADLVRYFTQEVPEVQLSLWLEDHENPLHHFHINVFDSLEAFERVRESPAVAHFTQRLYPHTARATHTAPVCDVWLVNGTGVAPVTLD